MIVCLCRGLADHAIRAAIARGSDTRERLAAACGEGNYLAQQIKKEE